MNSDSENVTALKAWLVQNQGHFNANAEFLKSIFSLFFNFFSLTNSKPPAPSGFRVVALSDLPSDSTIVKCPFSLAISKKSAKEALSQLLISPALKFWNERQSIASYLCFHYILDGER